VKEKDLTQRTQGITEKNFTAKSERQKIL
jgi:hypothetical protein